MLVYKPKQRLKQQTGLNYLSNCEMNHLKFSLTSQCNVTKQQFCVLCLRRKKPTGHVSSNNQSMQAHAN